MQKTHQYLASTDNTLHFQSVKAAPARFRKSGEKAIVPGFLEVQMSEYGSWEVSVTIGEEKKYIFSIHSNTSSFEHFNQELEYDFPGWELVQASNLVLWDYHDSM